MADSLETLKAELERFGQANDAATNERPRRMLNITRDTGEFLVVLVRATVALVFAAPAALAGYHAALGLAHLAIPTEGWRNAMAVAGAIIVAATAWIRMTLVGPPHPGRGLPPV